MKTRNVCLTPWHVGPGVALAKPAALPNGNVLLAAGTVLTESHLNHLRTRGIDVICVTLEDHRSPEAIAQEIADAETHVRHLFRGSSSAARGELADAILAYRRKGAG